MIFEKLIIIIEKQILNGIKGMHENEESYKNNLTN